jgi:ABC transporter substrate binding protein
VSWQTFDRPTLAHTLSRLSLAEKRLRSEIDTSIVCGFLIAGAEERMKARIILSTFALIVWATAHLAEAQQTKKQFPRVGVLSSTSPSSDTWGAFWQGLRELGYIEGKNLAIEYRSAEGKADRLPDLAAELVHLKVDLIVANGLAQVRAAKNATRTIPIVMLVSTEPGGNVSPYCDLRRQDSQNLRICPWSGQKSLNSSSI